MKRIESTFIKTFIPNATVFTLNMDKDVVVYKNSDSLFVLSTARTSGVITKEFKENIASQIKRDSTPIFYVTLFNNRDEMVKSNEDIAWGTYAWFNDAPTHYIHFDEKPIMSFKSQITPHK